MLSAEITHRRLCRLAVMCKTRDAVRTTTFEWDVIPGVVHQLCDQLFQLGPARAFLQHTARKLVLGLNDCTAQASLRPVQWLIKRAHRAC